MIDRLFPAFGAEMVEGDGLELWCRFSGSGPPVVLLHGFPQTGGMWHRIAPALAERHTVVVPDLRGYGRSDVAPDEEGHASYAKRAMAADVVALMRNLGHQRFAVVGHDRGARVGYRLALDMPEVVPRLAVLDIIPTGVMWRDFTVERAMAIWHWLFLAQPAPLPEVLIGGRATRYLELTLARWTATHDLSPFAPAALHDYRAAFRQPARIHAMCEDYRAGQTLDRANDDATRANGQRIEAPLLALWGAAGLPGRSGAGPLAVWREWARNVTGDGIDAGHFLCEENPDDTLAALAPFLAEDAG